jgi:hypothetical protein
VNGNALTTVQAGGTTPAQTYSGGTIGQSLWGTVYFPGSMADVQVYNSVLTSNQVGQLYLNNTVPGVSPIGYWPLNGNPNDYSRNGNNGVPTNVVYVPFG